ncbi:hypothetical protein BC827DRAFT_1272150 [Russula dissimulans]|nr:hypothetical protein BC827DRAFT_1272150 [Russula dissimulans]
MASKRAAKSSRAHSTSRSPPPPLIRLFARGLGLPIALAERQPLTEAPTQSNPHTVYNFFTRHPGHLYHPRRLRGAYARRMLVFKRNELCGDFVLGRVPVARSHGGVIAVLCVCGSFAQQREVNYDICGGLCSDAGDDDVWARAGVRAQHTEEVCLGG